MKRGIIFICFSVLLQVSVAQNQVGINQSSVDPSAVLEMFSTTHGFLLPRMSGTEKRDIPAPADGLLIYENTTNLFWYYNSIEWIKLISDNAGLDGIGDADSDTRILMDRTADDEQIRFYIGGVEKMRMNRARFDVINNGGSVFLGDSVGLNDDGNGNHNVFIGTSSGQVETNGRRNVGIGYQTLQNLSGEFDNVAIGNRALNDGFSARRNVAIGRRVLLANGSTDFHTAIGNGALMSHNVNNINSVIGHSSLMNDVSGAGNLAVGHRSLLNQTTPNNNVAVGTEAGLLSIGASNIYIGYNAGGLNTSSSRLFIDNSNDTEPLIFGQLSSNDVTINGDLHITGNADYIGDITDVSDRRLKKEILKTENVLSKICKLNGYRYHLISRKDKVKEYGLIAQEVKVVFPSLARTVSTDEDFLGVSYVQFIPLILEAEKEQFKELKTIEKQLVEHESQVERIAAEIKELKALVEVRAIK